MNYQPKFQIDQPVFLVTRSYSKETSPCTACKDGKVTLLDAQSYSCPKCYGDGKVSLDNYIYEVSNDPIYVTGIDYCCSKNGQGLKIVCNYFCMPTISPDHSVYEDSGGDDRYAEHLLFSTREEAVASLEATKINHNRIQNAMGLLRLTNISALKPLPKGR